MMRPVSAGGIPYRKSKIQFKTTNRGLCRRTEPRDADTQISDFLSDGTVPVLSFKATRDKIQASLSRPLQTVKTGLMGIATRILDLVVERWGCVDDLVNDTRGDSIDRCQAEQFIGQYLEDHNIPGKLQVRWVKCLSSGGKLQEYGRRSNPTGRKLRLWINSGFAGVAYSTSIRSFADHEICTHAVRAINDHSQVWVNQRKRYGLCSTKREALSTEEGLASLNSVLCYSAEQRHLWSAALLYYCAVKGQEMGFGPLHTNLAKYLRSPAKRYWYCVRTKGKWADLDQPGACGKGQVYLEGAVKILRSLGSTDFHALYSGRIPLGKLGRMKNIARSSLVTLPLFVQDQVKYKAHLEQIGRLNGIMVCPSPPPSIPGYRKRSMRRGKTRIKNASKRTKKRGGEESTPCEQREANQQRSLTGIRAASAKLLSAIPSDFVTDMWYVAHGNGPKATTLSHHSHSRNGSEDSNLACTRRNTDSATRAGKLSRPHTSPSVFTGVSSDYFHRSSGDVDAARNTGGGELVRCTRDWPVANKRGRGTTVETIKRLPPLSNIEKTTGT